MDAYWKLLAVFLLSQTANCSLRTTADRIRNHGYPVEKHVIQTADGYILSLFRIPPKNVDKVAPIVFLLHGLISSSDCWILNGPGQALGYLLSDAGYDVWLGNNRGNTYSRKHIHISPLRQQFWNFEWHDIALFDVPAMLDYVLFTTNQTALHYIGHSQGTTEYLVLTSTLPKYNDRIKSAHLVAPVAYMDNVASPLVRIVSPLLGQPNALVEMLGSAEFFPNPRLLAKLKGQACRENVLTSRICSNMIFLTCGWNKDSLNTTLLEEIFITHPAGASVNQIIHYTQEHQSRAFRQFDYGTLRNRLTYKQADPPIYDLNKVTSPTYLYYAGNDLLANVMDVEKLKDQLPNLRYSYKVPHDKWNHLDLLWGINVKQLVFDRIVGNLNEFEASLR